MKQMESEMNVNIPLEIVKASEIEAKEVKWLWYPYIPLGKVTLLQGDSGDGKSKLMLSIVEFRKMKSGGLPCFAMISIVKYICKRIFCCVRTD